MTLDNKIFFYEEKPRLPSENLAINKYLAKMVEKGKYDLVTRVYRHTPGVILGFHESIEDVNQSFCNRYGYEIVRRPTGGSAIVVDPVSSICYSVIFDLKKNEKNNDITGIYKNLTIPLAKNLGKNISVEGTYYFRSNLNGESVPFAGHALKLYGNVVQFDGVVNRIPFNMEALGEVLNLRKLHLVDGQHYVSSNGDVYDMKGKLVKIDLSNSTLLRDEAKELGRMFGLEQLGLRDEHFIDALYNTVDQIFGNVTRIDNLGLDLKKLDLIREDILNQGNGGKQKGLGHCFVDFVEPEPKLHHG